MEDGRVDMVADFQAVGLLSFKSRKIIDLEGCLSAKIYSRVWNKHTRLGTIHILRQHL